MRFSPSFTAILAFAQFPLLNAQSLQFDLERRETPIRAAKSAKFRFHRRGHTEATLYNAQGDLLYLVNATVGNPPQKLQLQLDTGSSDVWLPYANSQPCSSSRCSEGSYDPIKSNSSKLVAASKFGITYVDGTNITGDYISDDFNIGGTTVSSMTMGLATSAKEPDGATDFNGIVGIGFEQGESVYATSGKTYPNLVSMLKNNGVIAARAFSLWLNSKENGKGSLLFGGVDTAKYSGDLVSLPIQPDPRSNSIISFTVTLDGLSVVGGNKNVAYQKNNLSTPVILDSGTTITYLPDQMAKDLYIGFSAIVSSNYGGPVVPCTLRDTAATINFRFGGANGPTIFAPVSQFVLDFPPGFPPPTIKGVTGCRWGIMAAEGRPFLFGDTFLRGAYVVYNLEKNEVAVANAVVNTTSSNIKEFTNSDIPGVTSTASGGVSSSTSLGTAALAGSGSAPSTTGSAFDLGPTSTPGSDKKQGAANSLSGPRYSEMLLLSLAFSSLCLLLGGPLVLFF